MSWIAPVIIFAALVSMFVFVRRRTTVSTEQALQYLNGGALVVDVRSPPEFAADHLARAVNLPLDEIETSLPRRIQDKQRIILLHCQTGMRSKVASKKLQNLGYRNAIDLGSYSRAAKLIGQS